MTPLVLGLAMAQVVGLAADLRTTLVLQDSSTISWRPRLYPREGTAVDLENAPSANLRFAWKKQSVTLGYGPRFMLRDIFEERAQLVLHGAYASYSLSGPRYRFGLTEAVTWGEQPLLTLSFLAPPAATPAPQGSMPTPQGSMPPQSSPTLTQLANKESVRVLGEFTMANFDYAWSHRWSSSFIASYGISGGADAVEQQWMPRQKTAATGASASYALRREDTLITGVGLSQTVASNGYAYWLVTASETWKHRLTRELGTTIGGGLGFYTSKDPAGVVTSGVYPVMALGIDGGWTLLRRRSYAVRLQANSTLTPAVNTYTATLQERIAGSTTLGIYTKKSSLAGTVGGSQSFPLSAPDAVSTVGVGIMASHRVTTFAEISTGYRSAWQIANEGQTVTIPRYWTAFVNLTLYAPPIRF